MQALWAPFKNSLSLAKARSLASVTSLGFCIFLQPALFYASLMQQKHLLPKALLAILAGGSVAVFGTILHQSSIAGIPIGLLIGFGSILLLAMWSRRVSNSKLPSLLFVLGLASMIWVASQDLSGDKLVPANNLGFIWSYGSISLATLVAVWPRLSKSQWQKTSA